MLELLHLVIYVQNMWINAAIKVLQVFLHNHYALWEELQNVLQILILLLIISQYSKNK